MDFIIPTNVTRVTELLKSAGYEAFLVGGCVRDLIINMNNTDVSQDFSISARLDTQNNKFKEQELEQVLEISKPHETSVSKKAHEPKDWDITTNAKPEDIVKLFEDKDFKVVYENAFGTVSIVFEDEPLDSSIRDIQITPYRLESAYSDNRHPDSVSFSDTIYDDLSRRDFTMNAIAMDVSPSPKLGEGRGEVLGMQYPHPASPYIGGGEMRIIDPFHGKQAIEKQMIIAVGDPAERFREDALRILRAIRFSAQLGFTVSHETMNAIIETRELLKNISAERIRDEFIKIINSDSPAIALFHMKQLGLLETILPEIIPSIGCEQGGVHIYDVFDHLVHALQHAADKQYLFHIRLAALFHDIGKPKTRRPGHKKAYTFYGHEVVGARIAQKIMERLKFPKADTELVVKFVRWHMFFSDTESITLSAVRRMIANVGADHIWELMQIRECDRVGMNKTEAPYRLRKYFAMIEECLRDPISVSQLKIDGNYLMKELHVKPGPRMGWMLHALLEEVLEDPEKNTIEHLSNRVNELEQLSDAELKMLGEAGKEKKESADQEEVKKLHVKHNVKK
jgi:poly(A) polymerase/tRNA nucleotidyltransferase (CCA-adding enzyme)